MMRTSIPLSNTVLSGTNFVAKTCAVSLNAGDRVQLKSEGVIVPQGDLPNPQLSLSAFYYETITGKKVYMTAYN